MVDLLSQNSVSRYLTVLSIKLDQSSNVIPTATTNAGPLALSIIAFLFSFLKVTSPTSLLHQSPPVSYPAAVAFAVGAPLVIATTVISS
jgi:hypothetical protein